jgi:hypothetical protein
MTQAELTTRINRAIAAFGAKDLLLLGLDANERSMTHKLAEHLQRQMPNWTVDCEYNRLGDKTKRIIRDENDLVPKSDTNCETVYPDIIVHRRNTTDNLLVIEAKKSNNPNGSEDDKNKLRDFKREIGYLNAAFVEFVVGDDPRVTWEWIQD